MSDDSLSSWRTDIVESLHDPIKIKSTIKAFIEDVTGDSEIVRALKSAEEESEVINFMQDVYRLDCSLLYAYVLLLIKDRWISKLDLKKVESRFTALTNLRLPELDLSRNIRRNVPPVIMSVLMKRYNESYKDIQAEIQPIFWFSFCELPKKPNFIVERLDSKQTPTFIKSHYTGHKSVTGAVPAILVQSPPHTLFMQELKELKTSDTLKNVEQRGIYGYWQPGRSIYEYGMVERPDDMLKTAWQEASREITATYEAIKCSVFTFDGIAHVPKKKATRDRNSVVALLIRKVLKKKELNMLTVPLAHVLVQEVMKSSGGNSEETSIYTSKVVKEGLCFILYENMIGILKYHMKEEDAFPDTITRTLWTRPTEILLFLVFVWLMIEENINPELRGAFDPQPMIRLLHMCVTPNLDGSIEESTAELFTELLSQHKDDIDALTDAVTYDYPAFLPPFRYLHRVLTRIQF